MNNRIVLKIDLLTLLQWSFSAWVYLTNAIARIGVADHQIIRSGPCAHGVTADDMQVKITVRTGGLANGESLLVVWWSKIP